MSEHVSSERRDELAERRTETALHRTLLAEQRTYSAWIRTGLASAATGFALAQLMSEARPTWLVKGLAIVFILAGAAMFLLAVVVYRSAASKLSGTAPAGVPLWLLATLSMILCGAALAGLALVLNP